jgi:RNA polymerase sigma factor (TIGR02999 family)
MTRASPAQATEAVAPDEVAQLLQCWSRGDKAALSRMLPLIYDELRHMAQRHLQRERDGHTLQRTSLVHEAYLRLVQQGPLKWESRAHFFGWASTLMRHILIDHARSRKAVKRGGGAPVLSLDAIQENISGSVEASLAESSPDSIDLIALDRALQRLEQLDPQQSRVVELRFFGGLNVVETAEALDISPATVKREWATARAWLLRRMGYPDASNE